MELGFLQETKSILKSLVLSCPNGMTIDRLNRDYKEVVGSWIPYHKLGFSNLELFLKSLPDTLVVTGSGREARIGFVSNDKLQHMNEMVSRQKNTTRERKVAVLHGSSQKFRPEKVQHPNCNIVGTIQAAPVTTYCTFGGNALINNKPHNNYLYLYPAQSYGHQPNLIPQQAAHFNVNYLVERPIAYSIPQRKPQNCFVPANNSQYKRTVEPENYQKPITSRVVYQQNNNKNELDKQNKPDGVLVEQNKLKELNEPNNYTPTVLVEHSNSRRIPSEPDCLKSTLVEKENSKSISDQPENVLNQKAASSQHQISRNAVDEIKYPNKDKSDHLNKPERIPSQPAIPKRTADDHNNSKGFQQNTSKIEFDKPGSSYIEELKRNRDKVTAIKPVQPQIKLGSEKESSEETSNRAALTPVTESKNSSFSNNFVKKINADPFSQIDSSDNDIDEAVPEFAANSLVFQVDFPENTVAFGRKVPSYDLPKELTKGSVVGVFISEIHSPFKFWFHIYKDNHELDILMNRIECFYGRLYDSDLVIPKSCLAPGQVCAALFNQMWHRAEILSNVCNNKVKVHFFDYGTVSEIEIQNIKYLPTIFANTPMQAIRGSLSHIKPVSPLWPKRAIREFLSMVSEVLLYAQIIEIDEKEKTAYMVLCDTNSGETVQINKQLVDRGFAKLDSEWDENKIAKNGYRKRHPREIFPTFEMLETGEYPSLFELEQLLAQGIDYEKITEKIILSNLNNNVCDDSVLQEDCLTRKNTLSFNLLDTNPFKSDIISEIVSLKIFDD